jgi:hypothetical protein
MRVRNKFFRFLIVAIFVFTFVACSNTKNVCPAYSRVTTEKPVNHPG